MRLKRTLGILLVSCLTLTACGNSEPAQNNNPAQDSGSQAGSSESAAENTGSAADSSSAEGTTSVDGSAAAGGVPVDWDEDPAEVTWMLWNVGGTFSQEGLQAVEDAVNEITLEKINVHVNLEMLEMGTYMSQMPMQIGAGDKIDLITTFPAGSGSFSNMVTSGQLLPLDELLADYAPETYELVSGNILDATTVNGTVYAVPVYTDYTNDGYWICREAYLTEAGFTAEDIQSVEDITEAFEAIYALHPDMKMVSSGSNSLISQPLINGTDYDTLGTDLLAVMVDEDATKVVSLYESDAYKESYAILRDWYEKGYIDKDIMIREDDPLSDATVVSGFLGGNRARTTGSEELAGEPLVSVKVSEGCVSTFSVAIMTMGIPVSATEPEAAALSNVFNEYKAQISCGMADQKTIDEFIEKLYDNGFQTYIDEAQRQLDEWLASQN